MLAPPLAPARFWQLSAMGAASFLAVWTLSALAGFTSRDFLPTPWDVAERFGQLVSTPFAGHLLHEHLLSSLQRFAMGFVLAVCVGIALGLLLAWFPWVDRIASPAFETVRFIAPIAWVPFAALWFGTGIGGPVLIIFMGAFPPVLINTYRGAKQVDRKYIEASQDIFPAMILVGMLSVALCGWLMTLGLGWIERRVMPWKVA